MEREGGFTKQMKGHENAMIKEEEMRANGIYANG